MEQFFVSISTVMTLSTSWIWWVKVEKRIGCISLFYYIQRIPTRNLYILQAIPQCGIKLSTLVSHEYTGMASCRTITPFPTTVHTSGKRTVCYYEYSPGYISVSGRNSSVIVIFSQIVVRFGTKTIVNLFSQLLKISRNLPIERNKFIVLIINHLKIAFGLLKKKQHLHQKKVHNKFCEPAS